MGWKKVKVRDVTESLNGKRKPLNDIQRKQMKNFKTLYPYYGANNIVDYIDDYIFDMKILCIAEDGGNWGYKEKCSYIVNEKCWVNNHAHVLISKNNKILLEYLYYYLNYQDLSSNITGSTRGKLNKKSLENLEIPLPPMNIQIKIASTLDKAQELIDNKKLQLEKYNKLLQSVFMDMFGDPVTNPMRWDIKKGNLLFKKATVGIVIKPSKYYINSGIPAIRSLNVKENYILMKNLVYISKEDNDSILKKSKLEKNDIVIIRSGQPGTAAVINENMAGINCIDLIIARPYDNLGNSKFISFYLNLIKHVTLSSSRGQVQKHYNVGMLKEKDFMVPPIELQNKFASIVEKVEEEKKLCEESLKQMEENFNSIMDKAFKGELF